MTRIAPIVATFKIESDEALHHLRRVSQGIEGVRAGAVRMNTDVGRSSQAMGFQTANLAAQFNDIGVMMAAGQSPLMLALQQGTQVSQALGPMGAAGAVKALGAAFMSVLSPVNLVTIAAIGAGAAIFQWVRSADDEVVELEDTVESLSKAIGDYARASRDAGASAGELAAKYGVAAGAARELLDLKEALARREAAGQLADFRSSFAEDLDAGALVGTTAGEVARIAAVAAAERDLFQARLQEAAALEQMGNARSAADNARLDTLRAQIAAGRDVIRQYGDIAGAVRHLETLFGMNREAAWDMAAAIAAAFDAGIEDGSLDRALADMQRILTGPDQALRPMTEAQKEFLENLLRMREALLEFQAVEDAARARDSAKAATTLADLQAQRTEMELIVRHGRDSAEVAAHRAERERDVFNAMVDGLNVAEDTKTALKDAFADLADATRQTNNWAAAMAGVRAEIAGILSALASLAGGMLDNAAREVEIAALEAGKSVEEAAAAGSRHKAEIQIQVEFDTDMASAESVVDKAAARLKKWQAELALERADYRNRLVEGARQAGSAGGGGGGGGGAAPGELAQIMAAANRALLTLDNATAVAHEKARAGLITTAEAGDAVDQAARRAAEAIAALIPRLDAMGPAGAAAAERLRASLKGLVAEIGSAGEKLRDSISGSLSKELGAFIGGTKDASAAFDDFASFVKGKIAELLAQRFTERFLTPLIDALVGGISSILPFGSGGVPAAPVANASGDVPAFPVAFADGGVPGQDNLPGLSAHTGRIVTRPTLFRMPRGNRPGLMGEAGPEAIMPTVPLGGGRAVVGVAPGGERVPLRLGRTGGKLAVRLPAEAALPGLSAHADRIVTRRTRFRMPDGREGEMGEAGAEAIMPTVPLGGGRAVLGIGENGRTIPLRLARSFAGKLAVQLPALPKGPAFADGGVPGWADAALSPVRPAVSASSPTWQRSEPKISVRVENRVPDTEVRGEEREGAEGERILEFVVDQIESAVAGRIARGVSPIGGVLAKNFGVRRRPGPT